MRHFSIIILTIFFLLIIVAEPSNAALKAKVDYNIPVDYSNISEKEVSMKAECYFKRALNDSSDESIGSALFLYNILEMKSPTNVNYIIKSARLYDSLKKDRLAKGKYSKAIAVDSKSPASYFYFGEFYYKRSNYKLALKNYKLAYEHGFNRDYDTLLKLGDIYQKYGDTRRALKYFTQALQVNYSDALNDKIGKLQKLNEANKEYYGF